MFMNSVLVYWVIDSMVSVFKFRERGLNQVRVGTMLPPRMKKAITDNPKKLANLIDLVNLPSTLREFVGQSQISRLGCFMRVWSYIKDNNLQVSYICLFVFRLFFSDISNLCVLAN